jgi:hypothetical protein
MTTTRPGIHLKLLTLGLGAVARSDCLGWWAILGLNQ